MAKLRIYTFPDPVLAQKAMPIPRVDRSFFKLADDMLETMYDAPGIGLAANQVGLLQRIIVVDTDFEMEEIPEGSKPPADAEVIGNAMIVGKTPRVLINPEIVHQEGLITFEEGCLSVPEYTAEVRRAEKIKVQFQNLDGLSQTLSADGLLAICIQHEMDHLDGKLFIDRLSPVKKDFAKKKLKRERAEREEMDRLKMEAMARGSRPSTIEKGPKKKGI
jgi:peptide deformylase